MEKKGAFCYEYPRPAVCIDCVVFGWNGKGLDVLLIERKHDPWKGSWATPGGFVEIDETCETAAARELQEETGITSIELIQFHTFSDVSRDPRGRVISVSYFALVNSKDVKLSHGSDASDAKWFSIDELPKLAADHDQIIATAVEHLNMYLVHAPNKFGNLTDVVVNQFLKNN